MSVPVNGCQDVSESHEILRQIAQSNQSSRESWPQVKDAMKNSVKQNIQHLVDSSTETKSNLFDPRARPPWPMSEQDIQNETEHIFKLLEDFPTEAPFTLQRLAELSLSPHPYYSHSLPAYFRALVRCLSVSSSVQEIPDSPDVYTSYSLPPSPALSASSSSSLSPPHIMNEESAQTGNESTSTSTASSSMQIDENDQDKDRDKDKDKDKDQDQDQDQDRQQDGKDIDSTSSTWTNLIAPLTESDTINNNTPASPAAARTRSLSLSAVQGRRNTNVIRRQHTRSRSHSFRINRPVSLDNKNGTSTYSSSSNAPFLTPIGFLKQDQMGNIISNNGNTPDNSSLHTTSDYVSMASMMETAATTESSSAGTTTATQNTSSLGLTIDSSVSTKDDFISKIVGSTLADRFSSTQNNDNVDQDDQNKNSNVNIIHDKNEMTMDQDEQSQDYW